MRTAPESITKLIASFNEIQVILASIRAAKPKLLDDNVRQGFSGAEALNELNSVLQRLQNDADQTSREIRKLINE